LRKPAGATEAALAAAEHALRESEARFRAMIDSALDAVIGMDAAGRVTEWSRQAETIFGWSREEAVGETLSSLIVPLRGREAHERGLARFLTTGEGRILNRRIEVEGLRRDGVEFPVELTVTAVGLEQGVAFNAYLRDITGRKRAAAQLERQAREAKLLHRAALIAAESASVEDALRGCVGVVCELTGWPVGHIYVPAGNGQELVSSGIWRLEGEGDYERLRAASRRIRFRPGEGLPGRIWRTGEPSWSPEVGVDDNLPRGPLLVELGLASAFGFPIRVGRNTVAVLEFFSRTRTEPDAELLVTLRTAGEQIGRVLERREAQRSLKESEERLRFALDAARVGSWEVSLPDGKLSLSDGLRRFVQRTIGALATVDDMMRSIHPEDRARARAAIEEAIASGRSYRSEYRLLQPDGGEVWVESMGRVARDEAGRPVRLAGIALDVTERKRDEARRKLLLRELDHRVKNVLASVHSMLLQSRRHGGSMEQFVRSFEERLSAMGRTHDLLTARNWQGVSLRDLVATVLAPYRSERADAVVLAGDDVELPPATAPTLGRALHELATNAAKHGALSVADGKVAVSWRIAGAADARRLRLSWRETGGPPAARRRRGFGTLLIENSISYELEGAARLDFTPQGLLCEIDFPFAKPKG
jgi:PAS domain S-box-containing protein